MVLVRLAGDDTTQIRGKLFQYIDRKRMATLLTKLEIFDVKKSDVNIGRGSNSNRLASSLRTIPTDPRLLLNKL